MRVVHVSTFDTLGGAARAMRGLHEALRASGVDSRAVVQEKRSRDPAIDVCAALDFPRSPAWRQIADVWPLMLYRNKQVMHWTRGRVGSGVAARLNAIAPDVVHLHWIGRGFMSVREIGALRGPVVWTLHDSWAFTGGCHVPNDCTRYREKCGACPLLGSRREHDVSRRTWQEKARAWRAVNLTIVTPSRWLASCAAASGILKERRIEVIPNGIDTTVFHPDDRRAARAALGLPSNRPLILFGAMHAGVDRNKGLHLLIAALASRRWEADLVLFGSEDPRVAEGCGLHVHARGVVADDQVLRRLYSAADVTVLPSMLENYPNVILESFACGTPVVAFMAGGVPEMVEEGKTGFLARPYEVTSFAEALHHALENAAALRAACRAWVEREASYEGMARRYRALYESLLP